MKELNSPWVHWEGDTDTPGATEYINRFKGQLGRQGNGISLESTVASGNNTWNDKRFETLKTKGTVSDMLLPLFCATDVNIQSSGLSRVPSSVRADFFFDPSWSKFDSFPIDSNEYTALLEANGQVISDGGSALKDKDGKTVRDNVFPLSYAERAGSDIDYVNKLKTNNAVDSNFIQDVLIIDFTRPIFSRERCDLLSFAPDLPADKRDAASIRQGFIDNLKAKAPAAGSAAAQLLANLENASDEDAHRKKLDDFSAACKARPKKEFLVDVLKVASLNRNLARGLQLFEFPEALPTDNQKVPENTFFDPATCTLK